MSNFAATAEPPPPEGAVIAPDLAGTPMSASAAAVAAEAPVAAAPVEPKAIDENAAAAKPTEKRSAEQLPVYTKNLLHVRVPVSVTLTAKKQSIKQILDIAPGSLIQFDKSCDELLDLCVGDQRIAQGLAVKVGEKFGLRINHMSPPEERMQALRPTNR